MATPPTRAAFSAPTGNYTSTTSPKTTTAGVACQVGDRVVILASVESAGTNANVTPTASAGAFTWTLKASAMTGGANQSGMKAWEGLCTTAGTATFSLARINTDASHHWGFTATVWRGATAVNVAVNTSSGTSSSVAQATTAALAENSAVQVGMNDWNAVNVTSRSWQTVNGAAMTETLYVNSGGRHTAYGAYRLDVGAAGTKTVGLTTPATLRWVMVAVEVVGTSSGTTHAAAGTVPASTTTTASALARLVAAGTLAATTTVAASAAALLGASGAVGASSTVTGSATVLRPAAGVVAATSTTTGSAEVAAQSYPAAGTVAASSDTTGSATTQLPASGTIAASSTATAAATARVGASGTTAASTTVSGSASVLGGPVAHPAAGTVTATSTTTGTVTLRATAAGTAPAVTTTTGTGFALYRVGGTADVVSVVTGSADIAIDPDELPVVVVGAMQPARFTAAPALPTPSVAASAVRYASGSPLPPRYTRRT